MRFEAILTITPRLVRRATWAYWRRIFSRRYPVAIGLLALSLAYAVYRGNQGWMVIDAVALTGVLGYLALIYSAQYRYGMRQLRGMGDPQARFAADDEVFSISSGLGHAELPWSLLTEVWRFPGFWLIFLSRSQFFTIPLDDVSREMREFMLERARAAGVKVL